ncbi:MAG TPA: hypothetical protein VMF56_08650 [Acidobacteriaceae bacterium]|nr:hypothetical protein [Acidobacteriaceae bacterium]
MRLRCRQSYYLLKSANRRILLLCVWIAIGVVLFVASGGASIVSGGDNGVRIRVSGPGVAPHLFFACCDHGMSEFQALFADPAVIPDLQAIHAGLAVAVPDLSPQRAQIIRRLNAAGIPVIAWIQVPGSGGPYINSGDAPEAIAYVADFERWTAQSDLHWAGVGLDIEPDFTELARLKGHPGRIAGLILSRYFDYARVYRARKAYTGLIRQVQHNGYLVQTYQLPFIAAERRVHVTLLERLLGIVDVRGNQEALMIYSSLARGGGTGMIFRLGPDAQAIVIGVTEANPKAGPAGVPLNWTEFSRDLIVASHFTRTIGVYNLEGSVQQGFLARLKTMDWSQSVLVPASSLQRATQISRAIATALVIGSLLPVLLALFLLLIAALVWRRRMYRRERKPSV